MKNYYQILGVNLSDNSITIKKAYRKLALKFHPDRNKNENAHSIFIEITEAYEVLKDDKKRNEYNYLFNLHFGSSTSKSNSSSNSQNDAKIKEQNWTDYGRRKAKEYSSIPFEEFSRKLLKEIEIGFGYIPNLIAIVFCGFLAIVSLSMINEPGGGIFFLFFSLFLFYIIYKLVKVALLDLNQERKKK